VASMQYLGRLGTVCARASAMVSKKKSQAAPAFVTPMAAVAVTQLPEGPEWSYEVKRDGYRALVIKDGARMEIQSRNHKDLTSMDPGIVAAALKLDGAQVVLDGEIMALDESGRPTFQALQHRTAEARHQIVFYAFDVLHYEGRDVTGEPLEKRRALLPRIIGGSSMIRLSADLPGAATRVIEAVRSLGLEGVIAKRQASTR
jgi:bifunctional non-homologous end joining protein LigD